MDGDDQSRVFHIATNGVASISGFSIISGSTSEDGAGVLNEGTVLLRNITLAENTAERGGTSSSYEVRFRRPWD